MSETSALTEAVFYILLSLNQPRHGYGIMQETERMSGGRVHLAAGTLYGALNTLSGKGWIEGASGSADSRQKKKILHHPGGAGGAAAGAGPAGGAGPQRAGRAGNDRG